MEHSILELEKLFSCLQIINHNMRQKILVTNIFFYLSSIFLKETFGRSVYLVCSMWQSFDVVQRWYYYHDWLNDLQCDSAEERTTAIWLLTVCTHNSNIVFWNLYFRSEYIFVLITIVLFARWLHYRLCLTSDF